MAQVRCAQPLVGITGQKSPADERLFVQMSMSNPNVRGIAMLDARPYMNAVANRCEQPQGNRFSEEDGPKLGHHACTSFTPSPNAAALDPR